MSKSENTRSQKLLLKLPQAKSSERLVSGGSRDTGDQTSGNYTEQSNCNRNAVLTSARNAWKIASLIYHKNTYLDYSMAFFGISNCIFLL